jgi:hypothetical protein
MGPPHLFGPEMIDIVLRDERGFGGVAGRRHEMLLRRNRRQCCCLRARSEHRSARGYSKGEFQKVAAFHDIASPCAIVNDAGEFDGVEMNGR